MTDYFSIYSLILNASIVVQLVIGILLLASIGSWVVIVEKWIVTNNALKEFFLFEQFLRFSLAFFGLLPIIIAFTNTFTA